MSQNMKFWKPGEEGPSVEILEERIFSDKESNPIINTHFADLSLENQRKRLPIFEYRNHVLYLLEKHRTVIIVGETGSGKSTQIPQYLMEAGWLVSGKQIIGVTQPRRVAAVTLATRVAEEKHSMLGSEVGYSIRFDDCYSEETTAIKFMTDGILLREMMGDPLLKKYCAIMVDEAHERNLNTDMCLGLLKKIQSKRPELRIIITSATINAEIFYDFFNEDLPDGTNTCGIMSVEGRAYPVESYFSIDAIPDYVKATVDTIMKIHSSDTRGDILAFLTGQEEVEKVASMVKEKVRDASGKGFKKFLKILPLYSTLPFSEQMKVFEKITGNARKVVIATNIAETSVTIEGIVFVIDCGFVKIRAYNMETGLESLIVCPESQSSAHQRAGRAGRSRNGKVYRLFREDDFENLASSAVPEMQRSCLAPVVLQLKSLGVDNILRFNFISPPPAQCLVNALELLFALGAINEKGSLTDPVGLQMAEFPLTPMFAKVILNSANFGCSEEIISIVALLQVNSIFAFPPNQRAVAARQHRKFSVEEGDHITLLNVYLAFTSVGQENRHWCAQHYLNYKGLKRAVKIRAQLRKYLNRFEIPVSSCGKDVVPILRCLTSGFFSNAAKLYMDGSYRSLRGNNTLKIHPSSILSTEKQPKWIIFNEIIHTAERYMRDISVIQSEWLCELAPHYYESGTERAILMKRAKYL